MSEVKPLTDCKLTKRARPRLYMIKVDVKACFDTIKQDKLLGLLKKLVKSVLPHDNLTGGLD